MYLVFCTWYFVLGIRTCLCFIFYFLTVASLKHTVMKLSFWTDWSAGQTVKSPIRLLLKDYSDQGINYLPFSLHLLDTQDAYGKTTLLKFRIISAVFKDDLKYVASSKLNDTVSHYRSVTIKAVFHIKKIVTYVTNYKKKK